MNPLIDEVILRSTSDLQLTTHRVRMQRRAGGGDDVISIMLDQVASCGIVRRSQPVLLWLAALSLVLGLVLGTVSARSGGFVAGLVVAVLFGIAYLASRQQYLVIASAGETIRLRTAGVGLNGLLDFVDELEFAKDLRHLRRTP